MNWAIMILAFVLLWVLRKRGKIPWWVRAALAFIGGSALANTGLGVWIGQRLSDLAHLFPAPNGVIASVAAVIVAVIVVYDIAVDRKADKPAMVGLVVLPLLFLAAVGPFADAGSGLSDAVAHMATNSIGRVLGG